jgi:hypothetical protein
MDDDSDVPIPASIRDSLRNNRFDKPAEILTITGELIYGDVVVSQKVADLRSLVMTDSHLDTDQKEKFTKQLDEYESALEKVTTDVLNRQQREFELQLEKQKQDLELERTERTRRLWVWLLQRVLEKNLIASFIGGILLFIVMITLIIAMFMGKVDTNIVENAFLVLLGYFFGQVTAKSSESSETPKLNIPE